MPVPAMFDSHYCTRLGQLGWHNTDRIISIGNYKYSSDCHVLQLLTFSGTNFDNVHEPQYAFSNLLDIYDTLS
jgi:hypothetical protein